MLHLILTFSATIEGCCYVIILPLYNIIIYGGALGLPSMQAGSTVMPLPYSSGAQKYKLIMSY